MKKIQLLGFMLLASAALLAADAPTVVVDSPADAKARPEPAALSPMMEEIMAAVAETKAQVADLVEQARSTADRSLAAELQREAARVKLAGHVEILRIELRYAEQAGRTDHMATLTEAIARMTSPPRTGQPQPRPAPVRP